MKSVRLIMCAVMALMLFSCEKDPVVENTIDLPESIYRDLNTRYPNVKVTAYEERSTGKHAVASVTFIDKNGLENEAMYHFGKWYYTEKRYSVDDFRSKLPEKVVSTYLGLGLKNERFDKDEYHVIEIERNGLNRKQYEICCAATGMSITQLIDDLYCHIVIAEDGTLLSYKHRPFCATDVTYDMDECFKSVSEMFEKAEILGAIRGENKTDNYIFIREKGIVKTVKLELSWGECEWEETRYQIPLNAALPIYVEHAIENNKFSPDIQLSIIYFVETPKGVSYELYFGYAEGYHIITVKP